MSSSQILLGIPVMPVIQPSCTPLQLLLMIFVEQLTKLNVEWEDRRGELRSSDGEKAPNVPAVRTVEVKVQTHQEFSDIFGSRGGVAGSILLRLHKQDVIECNCRLSRGSKNPSWLELDLAVPRLNARKLIISFLSLQLCGWSSFC